MDTGSSPKDFVTSIEQYGFTIKEISDDKINYWKTFDKYTNLSKIETLDLYCYNIQDSKNISKI